MSTHQIRQLKAGIKIAAHKSSLRRRKAFLSADEHWPAELSLRERLNRWWILRSFGLGLGAKAHDALARSEQMLEDARVAHMLVRDQAVYSLLADGLSVRAIAAELGMTRATVGRIVKTMSSDAAAQEPFITATGKNWQETVQQHLLDAWGFEHLEQSLYDKPQRYAPAAEGGSDS